MLHCACFVFLDLILFVVVVSLFFILGASPLVARFAPIPHGACLGQQFEEVVDLI